MAKGARKGARKGGKKGAKRSGARRARNVSEYASLSETRTLTVSGGFVNNTLYNLMNTSLIQFTRATQVAKAYQHYRIKHISLKFKPTFDTYAAGAVNPLGKPNLYYMIDKAGAIPTTVTLEGLKNMGARPIPFDEKPVVRGWRPSVFEVAMTAGGGALNAQGSKYQISPWLNTNANSVNVDPWVASGIDHLGIYWYVETVIAAGAQQPYVIDVEVQFEFKKPLLASAVGQFAAISAYPAQTNTSRDGVVDSRPGGDDEELVH